MTPEFRLAATVLALPATERYGLADEIGAHAGRPGPLVAFWSALAAFLSHANGAVEANVYVEASSETVVADEAKARALSFRAGPLIDAATILDDDTRRRLAMSCAGMWGDFGIGLAGLVHWVAGQQRPPEPPEGAA
jgi:hypothetical protein